MIAVDTNILVYSMREDSPWHPKAIDQVREISQGRKLWAIPWPCVHEFLGTVTHPRIFKPPTPVADALQQVENWMKSPTLRLIGEGAGYWGHLKATVLEGQVPGPRVHDARIAAICEQHGVRELWSMDRDFSRFTRLRVRNPLGVGV